MAALPADHGTCKALEGTPLLHSRKARIKYHRVITGGTLLQHQYRALQTTPRQYPRRAAPESAVSRSPSSVCTAGLSAPASSETQRDRGADGHTQLFCARQQCSTRARDFPPRNLMPARRALRLSSGRCQNDRDGTHGCRRSCQCATPAQTTDPSGSISSTEWRFSAEPRVSIGLGVPDRKGCASSKVMSKVGVSVASAIAKERPASPPPRISTCGPSLMTPRTSAPQSHPRA